MVLLLQRLYEMRRRQVPMLQYPLAYAAGETNDAEKCLNYPEASAVHEPIRSCIFHSPMVMKYE
jgi:hypothetical protein